MKFRKTFTIEGRDYSAVTQREARAMYQDEVKAGLRHLDEGGMPKFLPLPDGRMICIYFAFGTWGYSFVNPDGTTGGGCSFSTFTSKAEAFRRAGEHAAQYRADAAA